MSIPKEEEEVKMEVDISQETCPSNDDEKTVKKDVDPMLDIPNPDNKEDEKPNLSELSSHDDSMAVAAMAVAAAVEATAQEPLLLATEENKDETTKDPAAMDIKIEEKKEETAETKATEEKVENPPTPMVTEESPYPYQINMGKDVISGKGGKVQQYNRHFRNLVADSYAAYDATTSKIAKRRIGVAIYNTIVERGGRFLDAQGKEMDRSRAVLKVMKALKDAKTWTSDAKRAAKERREAKQREGTEKTDKDSKVENGQGSEAKVELKPAVIETTAAATETPVVSPLPAHAPAPVPPPVPTPALTPAAAPSVPAPTVPAVSLPAPSADPPAPELPPPFKEIEEKGSSPKKEEKDEENEKKEEKQEEKKEKEKQEEKKEEEEEEKKPEPKIEESTDEKPADKDAPAETKTEIEQDSPAATRPKRSSKRRLPLNGSPPSKSAKKGPEEVVDSTNDAVRGLHLLSQATHAVARDKKSVEV